MRIKRRPDWRPRLLAVVEGRRRTALTFGSNDCALFCAACVEAMTGVDLAAPFRGKYSNADEARECLKAAGFDDVCAFIGAYLEEIHPVFARAGDVMAIPSDLTGWALGIVAGERVNVMRQDGIGSIDRTLATRAFRVP